MKVAIIGHPNVGKSSLFNRLIGKRLALETEIAGTTRDQNRGDVFWNGQKIELIDTPGLQSRILKGRSQILDEEYILESNIQLQAERALDEADFVLYLIDFQTGAMDQDREVIKKLRKNKNKQVLLVVNKVDKKFEQLEAEKFINLGLGSPVAVSAKSGRGTGELLDKILGLKNKGKRQKQPKTKTQKLPIINLAIIGKPNVGKSSLFNALLNEDKVVVSSIPPTTRDPNTTEIMYRNHIFNLVDTAGLRKKARIYGTKKNQVEIFSVGQTLKSIKKSDIALLMLDVFQYSTVQDLKISKLILDNASGLILVANKWDKIEDKKPNTLVHSRQFIYGRFKSLNWAPLIFTVSKDAIKGKIFGLEEKYFDAKKTETNPASSTTINPMFKLLDLVIQIRENQNRTIDEVELRNAVKEITTKQPPPKPKGRMRRPKILKFEQPATCPPTFLIELPAKARLPNHYLGYLKNQLRLRFGFWGTPVLIKCQNRKTKR